MMILSIISAERSHHAVPTLTQIKAGGRRPLEFIGATNLTHPKASQKTAAKTPYVSPGAFQTPGKSGGSRYRRLDLRQSRLQRRFLGVVK